jgi:2-polyprenyl-3-methyl-5-hydroxy-6-metoxy-1,4-benzoquinol methylase
MRSISRPDVLAAARLIYRDAPFGARLMQSLRPYICPFEHLLAHVPTGASVLDAGCGAGLLLALIAHFDPTATGFGFDTSVHAIRVARRIAKRPMFASRLRFETLSVTAEWPSGSYDVVSVVDVLHHVPPAAQPHLVSIALSRVRRGGLLIYKDMAHRPAWQAGWNRMHDLLLARQWINYRKIGEVRAWTSAAGAAPLAERRVDIGPYGHELLVAQRP